MKLYPAIDLIDGRCVRLHQGRFDRKTEYAADPVAVARAFAADGAEFLHVVDLDGARSGARRQTALVAMLVAESGLRVQSGGGVRTLDDARLLAQAGVERVVLGSLAVNSPDVARGIIDGLGAGRITLGLDVRVGDDGVPRVATHGWTATEAKTLWEAIEEFRAYDGLQILCTDIATDGTLEGPNVALYRECRRRYPALAFLASGGVGSLNDLRALSAEGVAGTIVGKALYEGRFTLKEALTC